MLLRSGCWALSFGDRQGRTRALIPPRSLPFRVPLRNKCTRHHRVLQSTQHPAQLATVALRRQEQYRLNTLVVQCSLTTRREEPVSSAETAVTHTTQLTWQVLARHRTVTPLHSMALVVEVPCTERPMPRGSIRLITINNRRRQEARPRNLNHSIRLAAVTRVSSTGMEDRELLHRLSSHLTVRGIPRTHSRSDEVRRAMSEGALTIVSTIVQGSSSWKGRRENALQVI